MAYKVHLANDYSKLVIYKRPLDKAIEEYMNIIGIPQSQFSEFRFSLWTTLPMFFVVNESNMELVAFFTLAKNQNQNGGNVIQIAQSWIKEKEEHAGKYILNYVDDFTKTLHPVISIHRKFNSDKLDRYIEKFNFNVSDDFWCKDFTPKQNTIDVLEESVLP